MLLWVVIFVLVALLWSLFQTTRNQSDLIAFSEFMNRSRRAKSKR